MLNVGKIVYLFDKKTHRVVPCKIIEKVNSITIEEEKTHHIVQTPSGKTLKLEGYKGPQFKTLNEARSFLLKAATSLIDNTIESTLEVKNKNFPSATETFENDIGEDADIDSQDSLPESFNDIDLKKEDNMIVDLGDGKKAKVSLPDGFLNE